MAKLILYKKKNPFFLIIINYFLSIALLSISPISIQRSTYQSLLPEVLSVRFWWSSHHHAHLEAEALFLLLGDVLVHLVVWFLSLVTRQLSILSRWKNQLHLPRTFQTILFLSEALTLHILKISGYLAVHIQQQKLLKPPPTKTQFCRDDCCTAVAIFQVPTLQQVTQIRPFTETLQNKQDFIILLL